MGISLRIPDSYLQSHTNRYHDHANTSRNTEIKRTRFNCHYQLDCLFSKWGSISKSCPAIRTHCYSLSSFYLWDEKKQRCYPRIACLARTVDVLHKSLPVGFCTERAHKSILLRNVSEPSDSRHISFPMCQIQGFLWVWRNLFKTCRVEITGTSLWIRIWMIRIPEYLIQGHMEITLLFFMYQFSRLIQICSWYSVFELSGRYLYFALWTPKEIVLASVSDEKSWNWTFAALNLCKETSWVMQLRACQCIKFCLRSTAHRNKYTLM